MTFETIRQDREKAVSEVQVASYPEDEGIVPAYFKQLPPLSRSVHDFGRFNSNKKPPLLKDILDRLYKHSDADFFIYSNADIALMPDFYLEVRKIIENGYDAFAVNRCTISSKHSFFYDIRSFFCFNRMI